MEGIYICPIKSLNTPKNMSHFNLKSTLAVILLLCCFFRAEAQKKSLKTKFGKLSDEELAMQVYAPDPTATGVILFDKGEISNTYQSSQGFIIDFSRHKRYKIFKKDALNKGGDVFIFYHVSQKVGDLKASSYCMENGKMVETELTKENIFDEKLTKEWRLKKFIIPGVKEGSIIEYKYSILSQGVGVLNNWEFQDMDMPTIWSEFDAQIPTFIEYKKAYRGWTPFTLNEEEIKTSDINLKYSSDLGFARSSDMIQVEYEVSRMHYIQENVPALKAEPFMPSERSFLSQIDFNISSFYKTRLEPFANKYRIVNTLPQPYNASWEKLGDDLLEDVYDGFISSSKVTQDLAVEITAGKTTAIEKVLAIYGYLGKNFAVVGNPFHESPYSTQSLSSLISTKKGSTSDINLLCINLLRQAGLEAFPILVSTQKHGMINPTSVSMRAFDRVLVAYELADKKLQFLDVSFFPSAVGLLSQNDLNGDGLLLRGKNLVEWKEIKSQVSTKNAIIGSGQIDAEGKLEAKIALAISGYHLHSLAEEIQASNINSAIKKQLGEDKDFDFSSVILKTTDHWSEPSASYDVALHSSTFATVSGNKIYFNPTFGTWRNENPFKNPDRKYPIFYSYPDDKIFNMQYTIPAGYHVEEAPKSAKINFADGLLSLDYVIEQAEQSIKINIRSKVKKGSISPEQYTDLRQYFSTIIAKFEEQIVLAKN